MQRGLSASNAGESLNAEFAVRMSRRLHETILVTGKTPTDFSETK